MEKLSEARVKEVCEGSIAQEAGIEPGDVVYKVNGEMIYDILEYKFLTNDEEIELEVIKADGTLEVISIINEDYEDLGIVFENPLIDRAKACTNKCIFCFIDQLPGNLRKTLYFKDDDSRLSFLQGNYVTLTNMTEQDIQRIIRFRLSPINISVHTTNPTLRVKMLGNEKASKIMQHMKKLAESHIMMNCQIVLCRGINDREELDRTLGDLVALYPYVNSISVVPVGLSRYREKLYPLQAFDKQASLQVLEQVEGWQDKLLREYGSRIVFLADEFYIKADKPIPDYEYYEDFPQIENGVGLITALRQEFDEGIKKCNDFVKLGKRTISIATGTAAKIYIESLSSTLMNKAPNLKINVYAIQNEMFGENVTVAGLVTGGDIIKQLKGKELGSELLIPVCMLRSERDVFLDDVSLEDVENALKVKTVIVEVNGRDFINKALGMDLIS